MHDPSNTAAALPVTVEIGEGFPPVRGGLATALFRVLQEMLTNVSRHSGAANATLKLAFASGAITLECRDDGQGIAPGEAEADDAFGIIGMRERCAAFGGTLYVRGEAGAGTTFLARIPFQEAEEGKD